MNDNECSSPAWETPEQEAKCLMIRQVKTLSRPRHEAVWAVEARSAAHLKLSRAQLAEANKRLRFETHLRRAVETKLARQEQDLKASLAQSLDMQAHLRQLSRELLCAQEDERKAISRELHDDIAQTLMGINVHLAKLKMEAAVNSKGLTKKIASTQRIVKKSVEIVHRFARRLRPTMLDDLGLIPALHTYMNDFTKHTGILIRFTAFAGIEQLTTIKRTVVYRVIQAALTNVNQHAKATRVKVNIQAVQNFVSVEIKDDGKSFQVQKVLFAKKRKRLGLLGMRERVEMVGGNFSVESEAGQGTSIRARIPFSKGMKV